MPNSIISTLFLRDAESIDVEGGRSKRLLDWQMPLLLLRYDSECDTILHLEFHYSCRHVSLTENTYLACNSAFPLVTTRMSANEVFNSAADRSNE
jgi:hypothetical protein